MNHPGLPPIPGPQGPDIDWEYVHEYLEWREKLEEHAKWLRRQFMLQPIPREIEKQKIPLELQKKMVKLTDDDKFWQEVVMAIQAYYCCAPKK